MSSRKRSRRDTLSSLDDDDVDVDASSKRHHVRRKLTAENFQGLSTEPQYHRPDTMSSSASDHSTVPPTFSETTPPSTARTEDDSEESGSDESSVLSDDTSEESDSSDEEDVDGMSVDGSEEEIVTVVPLEKRKTKPVMKVEKESSENGQSLRQRLKQFLPQMAAANTMLEDERAAGTLEDRNIEGLGDDEEDGYIEMNLGLGVLEQRRNNDTDTSTESESSDEEDRESNVLGKLLKREKPEEVGIEVIEEG